MVCVCGVWEEISHHHHHPIATPAKSSNHDNATTTHSTSPQFNKLCFPIVWRLEKESRLDTHHLPSPPFFFPVVRNINTRNTNTTQPQTHTYLLLCYQLPIRSLTQPKLLFVSSHKDITMPSHPHFHIPHPRFANLHVKKHLQSWFQDAMDVYARIY
jgi:hypothetical protein